MKQSRWLVLPLLALFLGVAVVAAVGAAGRCTCGAQMQFNMQMRVMMPPMQMQTFHPAQQQRQFQPLTPFRQASNRLNVFQPRQPQFQAGIPQFQRAQTPAFNVRLQTFHPIQTARTNTTWQAHTTTQFHAAHFPTLSLHTTTWTGRTNTFVPCNGGPGRATWQLTQGNQFVPKLGLGTARWSTQHTTFTSSTSTHFATRMTADTHTLHIPSLNFVKHTPTFVQKNPAEPTFKTAVNQFKPGAPNTFVARKDTPFVKANPGKPEFMLKMTAKISTCTCGCQNCNKGTPCGSCPAPPKSSPSLVVMKPQQPRVRPTALPALPPTRGTARPQSQRVVTITPPPTIRQPFAPAALLPVTGPLPTTRFPLFPVPVGPGPLKLYTTSLTAFAAPPKLLPAQGTSLLEPPTASPGSSMQNDLVSTLPPPPVAETPTTVARAQPLVVADLNPPALAPPPQPSATKLQLPNLVDLPVPVAAEKPAPRQTPTLPGPSLVVVLLQPPPLPSGATVAPLEVVPSTLDVPAVLPALVDTLLQPPPLPPLPGT